MSETQTIIKNPKKKTKEEKLEEQVNQWIADALKPRLAPVQADVRTNQALIDSVNKRLSELEDAYNTFIEQSPTHVQPTAPTTQTGLEQWSNLLTITNDRVTPNGFLGDVWQDINNAIRGMGGQWVSQGKTSHWSLRGGQTQSRQQRPQRYQSRQNQQQGRNPQIRNPGAPASEKQKNFLRQLNVTFDQNITMQEASNLIDHNLKK